MSEPATKKQKNDEQIIYCIVGCPARKMQINPEFLLAAGITGDEFKSLSLAGNFVDDEVILSFPGGMKALVGNMVSYISMNYFYANEDIQHVEFRTPSSLQRISHAAFFKCSNLVELTLPEGLLIIESVAFKNCSSLTSIHLPSTLEDIGDEAFSSCRSIENLNIPNNVTSLGKQAFCHSAGTGVKLPSMLKYLGSQVFGYESGYKGNVMPRVLDLVNEPNCQLKELRLDTELFRLGNQIRLQHVDMLVDVLNISNSLQYLSIENNDLDLQEVKKIVEVIPSKPNLKTVSFRPFCPGNITTMEWASPLVKHGSRLRRLCLWFDLPGNEYDYVQLIKIAKQNPELYYFGFHTSPNKELLHLLHMNKCGRILLGAYKGMQSIPISVWSKVFAHAQHKFLDNARDI